jgi:hypothetical protein
MSVTCPAAPATSQCSPRSVVALYTEGVLYDLGGEIAVVTINRLRTAPAGHDVWIGWIVDPVAGNDLRAAHRLLSEYRIGRHCMLFFDCFPAKLSQASRVVPCRTYQFHQ